MKWNNSMGSYKAYISLGATCQTAYQLKRLGLRRCAGPLDWFVSDSADGLVRLIQNRFQGFMELHNLEPIGATDDCFVIRDNLYGVESFHDFSRSLPAEHWQIAYPGFKATISRRVDRFLKTVKNTPVLFVRTKTEKKEAQQLRTALQPIIHDKSRFLIVNFHPDNREDVVYEDWKLDKVFPVIVPGGTDWKGSDQAWDTCMKGLKLGPR